MRCRIIPPDWLKEQRRASGESTSAVEREFNSEEIREYNAAGYNVFYHPNHASAERLAKTDSKFLTSADIDVFEWVFIDIDFKDGVYATTSEALEAINSFACAPTIVTFTGHGIHAYWRVSDLTAQSFLRLGLRLCRFFKSDPAVVKLEQLMRVPGTLNTKHKDEPWPKCEVLEDTGAMYACEALHKALPPITPADERKVRAQCDPRGAAELSNGNALPERFVSLLQASAEVRDLFQGKQEDRSVADFNLGRALQERGFSKEEAAQVLTKTQKASTRSPHHRRSYAQNIINRVWPDEAPPTPPSVDGAAPKFTSFFSGQIAAAKTALGERIVCHPAVDASQDGFRRGEVLGLVGGTGNGKSTFALNMTRWFAEYNAPSNYIYLYVLLESSKEKLGRKWEKMVSALRTERPDVDWDNSMCCLSNYDDNGAYRDLSIDDIREHAKWLESATKRKIGVIIIDHIGKLRQVKSSKNSEYDGLIGVCKQLNPLAVSTDTFVIVQSQTSRAKGDMGDVELGVDAAFGVSSFEWHVDHLLVIWQPLRRMYEHMPKGEKLCITLFKFCKARERNVLHDKMQLDVPYGLRYDPDTEIFRILSEEEEKAYRYWAVKAASAREKYKKRDPSTIGSITWVKS